MYEDKHVRDFVNVVWHLLQTDRLPVAEGGITGILSDKAIAAATKSTSDGTTMQNIIDALQKVSAFRKKKRNRDPFPGWGWAVVRIS